MNVATESQAEYFTAKSEGVDGKTLSIFYAPLSDRFTVPKEILRARTDGDFASRSLWKLITGSLSAGDYDTPTIEPSSVGQVSRHLEQFLRTQNAGGIFIDDEAPDEIKDAVKLVEEVLSAEAQTALADFLGIKLEAGIEDDRPYPGLYL